MNTDLFVRRQMRAIEEIIFGETAKTQFTYAESRISEIMSSRKMIYQLENHFDLDKALEEAHEAKTCCDLAINIIERTTVELHQQQRRKKEELKEEKLNLSIIYENSLKKSDYGFTSKEIEKRTEKHLINCLKEKESLLLDLLDDLDICKFELNKFNKYRENVDDVYMSIKKKYDLLIKRNLT